MSVGNTIGRAIGYTAAATVNAAVVTAKATGRFGEDVVLGTTTGYAEHSARFAALRAEIAAQRPASIAITVKRRTPAKVAA